MPTVANMDTPLPGSLEEAQQKYETTKRSLKSGIAKKRQIDRAMTDLESQIFLFEGSYLASTTVSGGNIVKGFDGYLKTNSGNSAASTKTAQQAALATAQDVPVEDRLFSLSSATYTRSLQLKANEGREQSPLLTSSSSKGAMKMEKDRADTTLTTKSKNKRNDERGGSEKPHKKKHRRDDE